MLLVNYRYIKRNYFNFFLIIEMEELELRELEYCLPENIDFEFFFVNIVYKFLKDIILSYDASYCTSIKQSNLELD